MKWKSERKITNTINESSNIYGQIEDFVWQEPSLVYNYVLQNVP